MICAWPLALSVINPPKRAGSYAAFVPGRGAHTHTHTWCEETLVKRGAQTYLDKANLFEIKPRDHLYDHSGVFEDQIRVKISLINFPFDTGQVCLFFPTW